jgi:flavin-dependent dehydrogenase
MADEMGEIGVSNRFDTCLRDRVVEAGDEVRGGVDESTVEIEDDKGRRHGNLVL